MTAIHDVAAIASPAGASVKFPAAPYPSAASFFAAYAEEITRAMQSIEPTALDRAAGILLDAYACGSTVFCCGNGGSAAIANHLQCDHVKGVRNGTDLSPCVVSLSASVELLTAIANDIAFEDVFAYQLQSQSKPGDVLVVVSSSGQSANIIRALDAARERGLRTIALTGFQGGDARLVADVAVHVDGANYGVIEDVHQEIMHVLAQYIRQSRMTADAISASVF